MASHREDTQSETTSCSTVDDRHFLTAVDRDEASRILGISEDEVVQERFRISRRGMEHLLFGNSTITAVQFFDTIMRDTNTILIWPARLKENAKTKKDPFITIRGAAANVEKAKIRVVEGLDPEIRSVTLKVDISYTDHSHIIGRGGNTIKAVMGSTDCHIHFPDCNRSSENEKSNIVSITGQLINVEVARAKIRALVPLVFSFDLPVLGGIFMPMEEHNPFIASLKEEYNVQVLFRTRQKLNSTLVLVKGCGTEYEKVEEATEKLIAHIRSPQAEPVQIHSTIAITPHHHFIVRGKDNANLNIIKRMTGTQITFPDLSDSNIPKIKRSDVIITGSSVRHVYLALQLVIGSLPVVFSFEMPESFTSTHLSILREVSEKYDVSVTSKLKAKANICTIFIKGFERSMENVYTAYKAIMNSTDGLPLRVEVPSTYILPDAPPFNVLAAGYNEGRSSSYRSTLPSSSSLSPNSAGPSNPHRSPTLPNYPPSSGSCNASPNMSPLLKDLETFGQPPLFNQAIYSNYWPHQNSYPLLSVPETPIPWRSSSIPSLRNDQVDSSVSGIKSNLSSPVPSATRSLSPTPSGSYDPPEMSGELYCRPPTLQGACSASYNQMRKTSFQVKRQPIKPSELRIPTVVWSGFGLSQSSPTSAFREQTRSVVGQSRSDLSEDGSSSKSNGSADPQSKSNYLEFASGSVFEAVTQASFNQDMNSLLASISMERYYNNFLEHEVTDVEVFLSLNESDLLELGINALGARKKLLMLIAGLNSRRQFRKTPGAERKKPPTWWRKD